MIRDEEEIKALVGNFVNIDKNVFTYDNGQEEDLSFIGYVAGYTKEYLTIDFATNQFLDEGIYNYRVILANRNVIMIAPSAELNIITEEEFSQKMEELSSKIVKPESKLVVPGRDF